MIEIPKVKLVNDESERLLERLHTLLAAHRYDYLHDELLRELRPLLPDAEDYCKASDVGKVSFEAKPKALALVDNLLDLEDQHVQEALCLGYVIGSAQVTPAEAGNPSSMERQARQIIDRLRLTELMEYNLSFGYVLTEEATAYLEARRSPHSRA